MLIIIEKYIPKWSFLPAVEYYTSSIFLICVYIKILRKYTTRGFVICLKHLKSQALLLIFRKYLAKKNMYCNFNTLSEWYECGIQQRRVWRYQRGNHKPYIEFLFFLFFSSRWRYKTFTFFQYFLKTTTFKKYQLVVYFIFP